MSEGLFSTIDHVIQRAGSSDPEEVIDKLGIEPVNDLCGSIIGYATRFGRYEVIGYHHSLCGMEKRLVIWHELVHVIRKHIYEPRLRGLCTDTKVFAQDIDSRVIIIHEMEANLGSADQAISTQDVYDITGYNTPIMIDYRNLNHRQKELKRAYEQLLHSTYSSAPSAKVLCRIKEYEHALGILERQKEEMEGDLISMNCLKTFDEIACELEITTRVLKYKLEAMRLRGDDINRQELEHYSKMYEDVL